MTSNHGLGTGRSGHFNHSGTYQVRKLLQATHSPVAKAGTEIPSITSLVSLTQGNNSPRSVLDNYSEAQRFQGYAPWDLPGHPYGTRERQNGWVLSKLVDANSRLTTLETMAELVDDLIQSQTRTTMRKALSDDAGGCDAAISAANVHLHDKLLPVVAFIHPATATYLEPLLK